jgi:hypothetical protein
MLRKTLPGWTNFRYRAYGYQCIIQVHRHRGRSGRHQVEKCGTQLAIRASIGQLNLQRFSTT